MRRFFIAWRTLGKWTLMRQRLRGGPALLFPSSQRGLIKTFQAPDKRNRRLRRKEKKNKEKKESNRVEMIWYLPEGNILHR